MIRKEFTPWFLLFIFSISFISCNVEGLEGQFGEIEEEEEIEDPNENAVFEVKLDGELFVASSIEAFFGDDGLTIHARDGQKKCIVLFPNPFVNNFSLNPSSNEAYLSYQPSPTQSTGGLIFISQSGSFNVTNFSDEVNIISGNFSGTLVEAVGQSSEITMTEGVMQNVLFFNENIEEPTEPDSTFMTASVDGSLFNANTVGFSGVNDQGTVTGNEANRTIELTFDLSSGLGDYNLEVDGFSATYSVDGNPQVTSEGTITLTQVSQTYVGGNFEFVTEESTIQSGVFGVNIE